MRLLVDACIVPVGIIVGALLSVVGPEVEAAAAAAAAAALAATTAAMGKQRAVPTVPRGEDARQRRSGTRPIELVACASAVALIALAMAASSFLPAASLSMTAAVVHRQGGYGSHGKREAGSNFSDVWVSGMAVMLPTVASDWASYELSTCFDTRTVVVADRNRWMPRKCIGITRIRLMTLEPYQIV